MGRETLKEGEYGVGVTDEAETEDIAAVRDLLL
jgi:hypothetical protein